MQVHPVLRRHAVLDRVAVAAELGPAEQRRERAGARQRRRRLVGVGDHGWVVGLDKGGAVILHCHLLSFIGIPTVKTAR